MLGGRGIGMLGLAAILAACSGGPDPEIRRHVAEIAAADPRVRERAALWLGEGGAGDDEALRALDGALADGDSYVRWAAALALSRHGTRAARAVPKLVEALADDRLWWAASRALWKIGRPAVPALLAALGEPRSEVRREAARTLGLIGAPAAVPALAKALDDPDAVVRLKAGEALGRIGPPAEPAADALARLLGEPDEHLQTAGADAIRGIGPGASRAAPALARLLDGDTPIPLVTYVQRALAALGEGAVPSLVAKLDEDPVDRRLAVEVLSEMGPSARAAAPALARLGETAALETIGPAAFPDLVALLDHEDPAVRDGAARALAGFGPAAATAVEALVRAMTRATRGLDECSYPAAALAAIGGPGHRRLADFLQAERPWLATDAANALALAGPAALPYARQILASVSRPDVRALEHSSVRYDLWDHLGPGALPALLEGLCVPETREKAALALRFLPSVGTVDGDSSAIGGRLLRALRTETDAGAGDSLRQGIEACAARSPDTVEMLARAAMDRREPMHLRVVAVVVLGGLPSAVPSAAEACQSILADRGGPLDLRRAAAAALPGVLEPNGAARALASVLDEAPLELRVSALQALASLPSASAREALPEAARRLADAEASVRQAATAFLGSLGPEAGPAAADLAAQLDGPDECVESALSALERIGPAASAAMPRLLAFLDRGIESAVAVERLERDGGGGDPDAWMGYQTHLKRVGRGDRAVRVLARIGPPAREALPSIARALAHGILENYASEALEAIGPGDDRALAVLVDVLPRTRSRYAALRALAPYGARASAALGSIEPLLAHPDLHRTAAAVICEVGAPAFDLIVRLLASEDESVRDRALRRIAALGAAGEIPTARLVGLLSDPRAGRCAAQALGVLGDLGPQAAEAIPTLSALLADPSVGWNAAAVLRTVGNAAVPALAEALRTDSPEVRHRAAWALVGLGPAAAPAAERLVALLEESSSRRIPEPFAGWEEETHETAARALRDIGTAAIPALDAYLSTARRSARERASALRSAILEAGRPPPPAPTEAALLEILGDPREEGREAAFSALLALGLRADHVMLLARLIEGPDANLREPAILALRELGPAAAPAVPALADALRDAEPSLRVSILSTLEEVGRPASAALDALVETLRDPDWIVEQLALEALGRLGPAASGAVPALLDLANDDVAASHAFQWGLRDALEAIVPGLPAELLRDLGDRRPWKRVAAAEEIRRHLGH